MTKSYTTTADYEHIDVALKSFWKPFNELLDEMDSFVPQPLSAFEDSKNRVAERIRKLNPHMTDEEIMNYAERQIAVSKSEMLQFWERFSDRFMTMHVTVTLLSQALCEAAINAILAVGLYEHGIPEKFADIQKLDVKDKCINGPKTFCPRYELKKSSALYETLNHLSKQRNSWMHHKSHLNVGDIKIIEGSNINIRSYSDAARWMKRYFSLPYDLAAHAHEHTHQAVSVLLLFKRNPIPIAIAHK